MYQSADNKSQGYNDSQFLIPLTVSRDGWFIFLFILQLMVLFGNLCLNSILCLLLATLKPPLRRPTHILVWHQVVLSLFVGLFCQTSAILELFVWLPEERELVNLSTNTLSTTLYCASVWNIAFLSIDMYRCVVKFSTYNATTTNVKMWISVVCIWIFSLVMGLTPVVEFTLRGYWKICLHSLSMCHGIVDAVFYPIYTILNFIGPLIILGIMFYAVGDLAKKHKDRKQQIRNDLINPTGSGMQGPIPVSRVLLEVKAARVLFLALSTYVICFTPHFTTLLMTAFGYWANDGLPLNIKTFTRLLLFAHTLFDPFFYGFRNGHVRKSTEGLWLDRCINYLVLVHAARRIYPEPILAANQSINVVSLKTTQESRKNSIGSSMVSKEDLVSVDVLEVYRSAIHGKPSEETSTRRHSWRYPKRVLVRRLTRESLLDRKESTRASALRSIGETAAALTCPEIIPDIPFARIGRSISHSGLWAFDDSDNESGDEIVTVSD